MTELWTGLSEVPEYLFALVLMLGVVITVHEFGHFAVAKLCGVRVLKFSIGFGPAIGIGRFRLAWQRQGTEYVIAWLPLGGFVKMLGEHPEDADDPALLEVPEDSLPAQPTWKKLAIVFAGPAMNLLLPVLVFAGHLAVGIQRFDSVVGSVERGSPAEAAGVRSGDRVVAVGNEPVRWWDEVEDAVRSRPGDRLALELERDGERYPLELPVVQRPGVDIFQAASDVGWVGLQHTRQQAILGITDADSPAAQAGLHSGDRVIALDGVALEDWPALARAYEAAQGSVLLQLERGAEEHAEAFEVKVPRLGSLEALGVIPAVVLVSQVAEDSAAAAAGLQAGDLIVAVDGEPVGSFATFRETVLASSGRALAVLVARAGETRRVQLAARPVETEVGAGTEYRIGIQGENAILPGSFAIDRETNPLRSLPRAVAMAGDLTGLFLRGLQKIVVGELSRRNVGGPIEIARQSHLALEEGWDTFVRLLVLISINVGILNLLPIPILDGGQALLYGVEGVMRAPLSLRTREFVQQVGLVVLVLLMGLAFWNDISRHWSGFVQWIRDL